MSRDKLSGSDWPSAEASFEGDEPTTEELERLEVLLRARMGVRRELFRQDAGPSGPTVLLMCDRGVAYRLLFPVIRVAARVSSKGVRLLTRSF